MVNVGYRSAGVEGIELRELRRWVAERMGDVRHERRVTRIATALFDLTADLHGLGAGERRLLRAGAILHDIGRAGGAEGHEVRGAREVLRGGVPGVPDDVRAAVAYLVRYHRGEVPARRREAEGCVPRDLEVRAGLPNAVQRRALLGVLEAEIF